MSTLDNTSIERRLAFLERGLTNSSTSTSSVSSEVQTETSDGTLITGSNLYIAYAESISNIDLDGKILDQDYATGFRLSSEMPFNSAGAPLPWIGILTSSSPFPSEDSTDYIWSDTATTALTSSTYYERYYTTNPGLLSTIGSPTSPGSGITWTQLGTDGSVPSDSFWLAERYTVNGSTSSWQLFPLRVADSFLPFIKYTKSGSNAPVLNSSTWKDDVVTALSDQTGLVYTNQREVGYGTVVVIDYDDATVTGVFKLVSGVDTWVVPDQMIPGTLVVDGTIAGDAIQANTITASKIAANTITASEIAADSITANEIEANTITASEIASDTITGAEINASTLNVEDQNLTGQLDVSSTSGSLAWGKTNAADIDTEGLWMGNSSGDPFFNIGDSNSYIQYSNGALYIVGAVFTGSSSEGTSSVYTTSGTHQYNIPPTASELTIDLVGAGAGGTGKTAYNYYTSVVDQGGDGGSTIAKVYNSDGSLRSTIGTVSGGVGSSTYTTVAADRIGEDFSAYSFTGTGGTATSWNRYTPPYWTNGDDATGNGAGGGGGLAIGGMGGPDTPYNGYVGGEAGSSNQFTYSPANQGEYIIFTVGAAGAGGEGGGWFTEGGGSEDSWNVGGQGSDGAPGAGRVTVTTG